MSNNLMQDRDGNESSGRWGGIILIAYGLIIGALGLFVPGAQIAIVLPLFSTSVITGAGLIGGSKAVEQIRNLGKVA